MNGSNQILPLREHKELNKVAAAWIEENSGELVRAYEIGGESL